MFNIDFSNPALQVIHHSRFQKEAERATDELRDLNLKSHLVIFSSGTTSASVKGYALSKDALFTNAEAVNKHFNLSSKDVWGLSIPYFHVGGLSVLARSYVLGSKLVNLGNWNHETWPQDLETHKVTVTTVVPTQVYDLVKHNRKAPHGLKYLIVGGDFLSNELTERARVLGWPIIKTFGMTEVSSQLASGNLMDEGLKVLPIHEVKTTPEERLLVKSSSLFTLQFTIDHDFKCTWAQELCDSSGYYITQDRVQIENHKLLHLGRLDDQIKVSGRLHNLTEFRDKLATFCLQKDLFGRIELFAQDHPRKGKQVVIASLPMCLNSREKSELAALLTPLPLEFQEVASFERTDLGKLKISKTP